MAGARIVKGERFSKLVAVEMVYKTQKNGRKRSHWICRCDCGELTTVDSGNLRNSNTRWCNKCSLIKKGIEHTTHGQNKGNRPTKLYYTWQAIKRRIFKEYDNRYTDYGGRGLDMSPEWAASFEKFRDDMGNPPTPKHQIDRTDNERGYWPDNCKWVSQTENSNNKRNNIVVTLNGVSKTLPDWCRELGLNYDRCSSRIKHGHKPEDVLKGGWLPQGPAHYIYSIEGKQYKKLEDIAKDYNMSVSGVNGRVERENYPNWTKTKI